MRGRPTAHPLFRRRSQNATPWLVRLGGRMVRMVLVRLGLVRLVGFGGVIMDHQRVRVSLSGVVFTSVPSAVLSA